MTTDTDKETPDLHDAAQEVLAPRKVYKMKDYVEPKQTEPFKHDWRNGVPIVIDFGRHTTRVGMAGMKDPSSVFPSITSHYKDKKLKRALNMVGNDVLIDSGVKSNMKNPFDGSIITNWNSVESILDYSFLHVGVDSQDFVESPVIMTEPLVSPFQQRSGLTELLFETYSVPKCTFGVDSLFSFYYNGGHTGLVIGSGYNSTKLIPVVGGKPILDVSKRIDWAGRQAVEYLSSSLQLKYPYFPSRINDFQVENMVKDFCYVSNDYQHEVSHYLDLDNLEKKDITLEAPFNEIVKQEKTEEELRQEEEKKKQTMKKLQEQARERRLQKLLEKEHDYEYFTTMETKLKSMNKKEVVSTLREAGFDDDKDLHNYISNLERSLKRARNQDVGENDASDQPPSFDLIDIPDEKLDEEQIKEKRKQRLMKAGYDARQRAKKEKEIARKTAEEAAKKDEEWRKSDLSSWIAARRKRLRILKKRRKDRIRLKEELTDRKSRASQLRMKNIASLASEESEGRGGRKRKATNVTIDNDPNDTFGANDDDWSIYRDIAKGSDSDVEEEYEKRIYDLEEELLRYDPEFTINDTLQAQYSWKKSIIHRFVRGPRDWDPDEQHQQHQIHLNVERIRVPEIIFQPSIAGLDQCGLSELCEQTALKRLPSELGFSGDDVSSIVGDVFLTGGSTLFKNFDSRLRLEFESFLPVGMKFNVRRAEDPLLDTWRGMAKWAVTDEAKSSYITKKQYEEMGPEYLKENRMGCAHLL
ncbi:hypothetical protein HII12_002795 [Brettanomyces bruxellensis]|uniref:Actin-related protein 5 n=1 Tax=Dekkera bruxellensis TaxID=5007 RepID=A0A8H6EUA5_DEKBR|nr:hypothetical protein HII12_002795 [Brettanomyces bruxellensis]